ncbi:MAG: hypothetical protein ACI8UZ_002223 [Akkermansiaceae bacterium]|jgi:hypothetical protein
MNDQRGHKRDAARKIRELIRKWKTEKCPR